MRPDQTRPQAGLLLYANWATLGGLAVLLLTTVHHLYGAYVYETP